MNKQTDTQTIKYKHTITLKLDTKTFTKLNTIIKDLSTNKSEFIRTILNEIEVDRAKKIYTYKQQKEEFESNLLYELNRIGNNINQLAKYANTNKNLDVKILKELEKISEFLDIVI